MLCFRSGAWVAGATLLLVLPSACGTNPTEPTPPSDASTEAPPSTDASAGDQTVEDARADATGSDADGGPADSAGSDGDAAREYDAADTEAMPSTDGGDAAPDADATVPVESGADAEPEAEAAAPMGEGGACSACTGQCVNGRCLVTLASGTDLIYGLAIAGDSLYWTSYTVTTSTGSIMRVSVDGGSPVPLTSANEQPGSLCVNGGTVYWGFSPGGTYPSIMSIGIDGGSPVPVAMVQISPGGVAADSTNVYWADRTGGFITQAALDGGAQRGLANNEVFPGVVAVDSTSVYFAATSRIVKVPKGSDNASKVLLAATSGGAGDGLVVRSGTVYFTSYAGVMRVSVDGGGLTPLVSTMHGVGPLAADDTSVYWEGGDGGILAAIMKAATDGGSPVMLYDGVLDCAGIVVDDTSVYFTDNGKVMKLTPK